MNVAKVHRHQYLEQVLRITTAAVEAGCDLEHVHTDESGIFHLYFEGVEFLKCSPAWPDIRFPSRDQQTQLFRGLTHLGAKLDDSYSSRYPCSGVTQVERSCTQGLLPVVQALVSANTKASGDVLMDVCANFRWASLDYYTHMKLEEQLRLFLKSGWDPNWFDLHSVSLLEKADGQIDVPRSLSVETAWLVALHQLGYAIIIVEESDGLRHYKTPIVVWERRRCGYRLPVSDLTIDEWRQRRTSRSRLRYRVGKPLEDLPRYAIYTVMTGDHHGYAEVFILGDDET